MTKGKIDEAALIEQLIPKTITSEKETENKKSRDEAYTQMCVELYADTEFRILAIEDASYSIALYSQEKEVLQRDTKRDGDQEISINGKKAYASQDEIDMMNSVRATKKDIKERMIERADQFFLDNGMCDTKEAPGLYNKLEQIIQRNEDQIKNAIMQAKPSASNDIEPIGLTAPKIAANLSAKSQIEI